MIIPDATWIQLHRACKAEEKRIDRLTQWVPDRILGVYLGWRFQLRVFIKQLFCRTSTERRKFLQLLEHLIYAQNPDSSWDRYFVLLDERKRAGRSNAIAYWELSCWAA